MGAQAGLSLLYCHPIDESSIPIHNLSSSLYNGRALNDFIPENHMALKIRNAKRSLTAQPRYVVELRMDIEIDQGHPLTTAQDKALKQLLSANNVTVQDAADRLIALRPKSQH